MKKWLFFLLLLFGVVASGCQNQKDHADDTAYDLRTDSGTPNYMANRNDENGNQQKDLGRRSYDPQIEVNDVNDRDKNKQHQVEDDITQQNPNFLDLRGTGSGSEAGAGNQGNDIDKAKQVIADTKEFEADNIWINGDRMWVSVYKKGMLNNKEKVDAEARLHKKLVTALPRYNIEVKVQEDRK